MAAHPLTPDCYLLPHVPYSSPKTATPLQKVPNPVLKTAYLPEKLQIYTVL